MDRYWGYVSVIVATIFFGIWNTFSKILLQDLHPLVISASVYLIGGLILFLVHYSPLGGKILSVINANTEVESYISKKDYAILAITVLFGAVVAPFIYLNGLNEITAVNAALLMNVEILFVIIIGILFLKESFVKKDIIGFLFLISGAVFLAINGRLDGISLSQSIFGSLLIISAAFFWSIDTSLSKFLSNKRDLILITGLKCFSGGVILLLLVIAVGESFKIALYHLPYLFFIGIFGTGLAFVLVYFAIRLIGSTRTGSLFSFSSLFGAMFAFIILSEPLTLMQLGFGVLMVLGVFILYKTGIKTN